MADTSLVFNILAVDKASSKFDRIKASAALLGAAVGAMAVKFGKDGVGAASDLSETLNKSNVIFGKNAAAMSSWADGAAKNFGLSKAAALDSAANFGNMFDQLGFGGKETAKLSQSVVKLSADLGSFNNLPTAEVADMMSGAFRGEYDSLQRLIPNINAARVEQAALAATGKKSVSALTAQEKAAATLAIVQKDGAAATNDFAETSGSLANQQKILRATYEDVSAQVGGVLLPAITSLASNLLSLIGFVRRNSDIIVPLVGAFGGLAAAVWAVNAAKSAQIAVLAAWGTVSKVGVVWTGAMAAAQWALNAAMSANPIGLVVLAIAALVAGVVLAYKKSETFRKVVDGSLQAVGMAFTWLADRGRAALGWLQDRWGDFKNYLSNVKNAFRQILGSLFDPIHDAWTSVRSWMGERWGAFREWVGGWKETITGKVGSLFGGIRDAWTSVRTWVGERWESFKGWIGGLSLDFDGMFDGLTAAFKSAVNAIIRAWNNLSFSIPGFNPPGPGKFAGVSIGTPNIPYLAKGGIVTRPTLAMVGEAGPEAVIPLSRMREPSGEVTNNFYVTIDGASDPGAVVAALHAYVKRNGPIRGVTA